MKKVGKTARPFRYDLNQIPYDYTAEVRNRIKGLDLIDRIPDELRMEVRNIVQETRVKTIPMEKKYKKAKWLSGEALPIAVKRREVKSKGEKEIKGIRIGKGEAKLSLFTQMIQHIENPKDTIRKLQEVISEFSKMVTITLYARQQKRHRGIEQSFVLCGRA